MAEILVLLFVKYNIHSLDIFYFQKDFLFFPPFFKQSPLRVLLMEGHKILSNDYDKRTILEKKKKKKGFEKFPLTFWNLGLFSLDHSAIFKMC